MKEKYKNINESLIEACRKGKQKAQFELYEQYSKAMFNASLRILQNAAEAEDAMQEGFLKAFQNIKNYSGEVSFGAWLKKIIINKSLDYLRKKKFELEDIENFKDEYVEDTSSEDDIAFKVEEIKRVIKTLPDGYRVVLSLYLLEGYDHDEIGGILQISASTSRSQLARAKKKLIEKLKSNNN